MGERLIPDTVVELAKATLREHDRYTLGWCPFCDNPPPWVDQDEHSSDCPVLWARAYLRLAGLDPRAFRQLQPTPS